MAERITPDQFFASQLDTLETGDIAHHSMLYPGVYPSDQQSHEDAKQGVLFVPSFPYYAHARKAMDRGAEFEWLRVMPEPGEFGYDDADIEAMQSMLRVIAKFGHNVRTVAFSDQVFRIMAHCGEDSPLLASYLNGIRERDPKKSFWSVHKRRHAGSMVLDYVGIGDYHGGQFNGYQAHVRSTDFPLDEHTAKWNYFWRDVYLHYAEPVSPDANTNPQSF